MDFRHLCGSTAARWDDLSLVPVGDGGRDVLRVITHGEMHPVFDDHLSVVWESLGPLWLESKRVVLFAEYCE